MVPDLPAAAGILYLALFAVLVWIGVTGLRRRGWRSGQVALRGGWGTVYVFLDRDNPALLKVGTTRRRTGARKAEVSRVMTGGCALVQVYALDMPYARAVEALAHRRLARWRYRSERGREWYRLPGDKGVETAIGAIEAAARAVRRMARRQRRWSPQAEIRARAWRRTPAGAVRSRLFGDGARIL